MKKMKKFLYFIVGMTLVFSVTACGEKTKPEEEQNEQAEGTNKEALEAYAEAAEEYLPMDEKYRLYNGYAEAGFEVQFQEKNEIPDAIGYTYKGTMTDGIGCSEDEDRTFLVHYVVYDDGMVVEYVENNDPHAESPYNVYSKVPGLIVLKGEVEEGNTWEQAMNLDGVEGLTAVTTITEVTDDTFTTVTEIEADGYAEGKYREERQYTKGVGLTGFNNTPLGSDKDDTLIFGYGFSVENDESIAG